MSSVVLAVLLSVSCLALAAWAAFGGFGKETHSFHKSLNHGVHQVDHNMKKDQQVMKQAMHNPMKALREAGVNIDYKEKNLTFGLGGKVHEKETSCVDGSCETRARTGHIVNTNSTEMADKHAQAEKQAEAEKEAEARKVQAERLRKEKMEHTSKVKAEAEAKAEQAKAEVMAKRERNAKTQAAADAKREETAKVEAKRAAMADKESLAKAEQASEAKKNAQKLLSHYHAQTVSVSAGSPVSSPQLLTEALSDGMSMPAAVLIGLLVGSGVTFGAFFLRRHAKSEGEYVQLSA